MGELLPKARHRNRWFALPVSVGLRDELYWGQIKSEPYGVLNRPSQDLVRTPLLTLQR
jgi:hypothetical protein